MLAASRAIADGKRSGTAAALLACTVETVIRPYGVVLFLFPLVFGRKGNFRKLQVAGTAGVAAAAVLFSLWGMNTLAAPYSEQSLDFTVFTRLGQGDILGAAGYFSKNFLRPVFLSGRTICGRPCMVAQINIRLTLPMGSCGFCCLWQWY